MLDKRTAVSVFEDLERERQYDEGEQHDPGYNPPTYRVRLDAEEDRDDQRWYRLFVRAGKGMSGKEDEWRYVLDLAARHELDVSLDNDGVVLQ